MGYLCRYWNQKTFTAKEVVEIADLVSIDLKQNAQKHYLTIFSINSI